MNNYKSCPSEDDIHYILDNNKINKIHRYHKIKSYLRRITWHHFHMKKENDNIKEELTNEVNKNIQKLRTIDDLLETVLKLKVEINNVKDKNKQINMKNQILYYEFNEIEDENIYLKNKINNMKKIEYNEEIEEKELIENEIEYNEEIEEKELIEDEIEYNEEIEEKKNENENKIDGSYLLV